MEGRTGVGRKRRIVGLEDGKDGLSVVDGWGAREEGEDGREGYSEEVGHVSRTQRRMEKRGSREEGEGKKVSSSSTKEGDNPSSFAVSNETSDEMDWR